MLGRPAAAILASTLFAAGFALAAEPIGQTLPWNILECHFAFASIPVPASALASRLPTGWRPWTTSTVTAGFVADFALEANQCDEGSGLDGQVSPMQYVSTWSPVSAPSKFATPGVPFMVANWDVVVPDDDRRALLAANGAPVFDGAVSFGADLDDGLPLTPFTVEYTIDGIGDYRFDIVPVREITPPFFGEFAQYTIGTGGSLTYWRTEWAAERQYQGIGLVTVPEGSWHAQVLGDTQVAARFAFGTWDYTNGKIVIPS